MTNSWTLSFSQIQLFGPVQCLEPSCIDSQPFPTGIFNPVGIWTNFDLPLYSAQKRIFICRTYFHALLTDLFRTQTKNSINQPKQLDLGQNLVIVGHISSDYFKNALTLVEINKYSSHALPSSSSSQSCPLSLLLVHAHFHVQ